MVCDLVDSTALAARLDPEDLLDEPKHYMAMARAHNPFGDGHASERIARVILDA